MTILQGDLASRYSGMIVSNYQLGLKTPLHTVSDEEALCRSDDVIVAHYQLSPIAPLRIECRTKRDLRRNARALR